MTRTLVIIGNGMVGHHLVEQICRQDPEGRWRIVVLAEEPLPAYDRTALSLRLSGQELRVMGSEFLDHPSVEVRLSCVVTAIDRRARTVTTTDATPTAADTTLTTTQATVTHYDALVLATGARPFVPAVAGRDLPGCFVYRTVQDIEAIREAAVPGRPGVVVGGGLLGLEAANALRLLEMRPHVVEMAPHLLPLQIDHEAGQVLAGRIADLGVQLHCSATTRSLVAGPDGRVAAVMLDDCSRLEAELVVFATGVRPRDDLADSADLKRGDRGGFLVDAYCRTADRRVWAVGDCAAVEGRCYGLLAPGYRMAETVAEQILGVGARAFTGADTSTKLKLLGVDVASFGDSHARTPGALEFVRTDHTAGTYAKVVLAEDARTLLGGVLTGDSRAHSRLHALIGRVLPAAPDLLLSTADTRVTTGGSAA